MAKGVFHEITPHPDLFTIIPVVLILNYVIGSKYLTIFIYFRVKGR